MLAILQFDVEDNSLSGVVEPSSQGHRCRCCFIRLLVLGTGHALVLAGGLNHIGVCTTSREEIS